MDIWIEDVIIDNLIIDTLILLTTSNLAKIKAEKIKLFFSAGFGASIALITPMMPYHINLLAKPVIASIMILLAFKIQTFKSFFSFLLLFFLTTFIYGGASIAVCEMIGIKYSLGQSIQYQNNIPVGVIMLVCALIYVCTKKIIITVFSRHQNDKYEYKITIQNDGQKTSSLAFLDTGNKLTKDNKPITIINYTLFNKLYPEISLQNLLLKKYIGLKNEQYIEVESLENMKQKILIFEVDELTIDNKNVQNAILGLTFQNFSQKLNCDAIISNKILEMGEYNEL